MEEARQRALTVAQSANCEGALTRARLRAGPLRDVQSFNLSAHKDTRTNGIHPTRCQMIERIIVVWGDADKEG